MSILARKAFFLAAPWNRMLVVVFHDQQGVAFRAK